MTALRRVFSGWHVMRGDGSGTTIYLGQHQGARYFSVELRGFNGWQSYPTWMPGGWEFYSPRISSGWLFTTGGVRSRSARVLIPAKLASLWRMRDPEWRRAMHEEPIEETNV